MQARAPLMIEHRLIERMIGQIQKAIKEIESDQRTDPYLIDTVVDFLRFYADRTHHGKEEDILFRDLGQRELSADDRRTMDELIQEHRLGRRTTKEVVAANTRYRRGDQSALSDVLTGLRTLVDFYPTHIAKEDTLFFPAVRSYFTEEEDQAMLAEFREFDRKMIHEKYESLLDSLEKGV